MLLAVAVTLATPEEFVTAVLGERTAEGPLTGAENVTVTPAAGAPEDVSITWSGCGKAVPGTVCCGAPMLVSDTGPVARLLNPKNAVMPRAVAFTTYPPVTALAVAVTLATQLASVTAVLLESTADAPLGGAIKVTVTPLSGLAPSFTVI